MSQDIIDYFPPEIKKVLLKSCLQFFREVMEIRLRVNCPLEVVTFNSHFWLTCQGEKINDLKKRPMLVKKEHLEQAVLILTNNSLYALERQMKEGFITIQGGHRVGFTGEAVIEDKKIKTIKNVNSLNYRLTREIIGAGRKIIKTLYDKMQRIFNTMIISPPLCGKTTLLRDLVRLISYGHESHGLKGKKIALVDERSEIAGAKEGIAQNDIGPRTDLLDNCPKAEGMMLLIRSMSPEVIAVDEIGSKKEVACLKEVIKSGVSLIVTVHGQGYSEVRNRPGMEPLFNGNLFERYIILSKSKGIGTVESILDSNGEEVS
ncbi:MAG: stage III sporulation protein AA [Bacillota bacterium]